jgi:hypothetical protein
MIALKALIGGPPGIFSGPGEPLVRSTRTPFRSKLISGAGMKLRVAPSALLLILGGASPIWSPSRRPRRQRPTSPTGINNHHQIAGVSDTAVVNGFNAQGQEHAFLLTQRVSAARTYRPPDSCRTEQPTAGAPGIVHTI